MSVVRCNVRDALERIVQHSMLLFLRCRPVPTGRRPRAGPLGHRVRRGVGRVPVGPAARQRRPVRVVSRTVVSQHPSVRTEVPHGPLSEHRSAALLAFVTVRCALLCLAFAAF